MAAKGPGKQARAVDMGQWGMAKGMKRGKAVVVPRGLARAAARVPRKDVGDVAETITNETAPKEVGG